MLRSARASVRLQTVACVTLAGLAAFTAGLRPAIAQTFSTGANFTSMSFSQSTGEPPDTMGAAGPNHFVVFQNDGFSIFTKSGTPVSAVSPNSFWTSALGSDPGGLTDPRILYDPASQRWFAVMITTDQTTNNKILFARSNTSDPTQGFKGVAYTTTNNRFADFPTFGLDANGVYVGTNNFTAGGSFTSVGAYSVPKADLVAATPSLSRLTAFANLDENTRGFSLQPAVDYGPKLPTDRQVIVAKDNNSSNQYDFTPLTGTTNSGATLGSSTSKTVQSITAPSNSAQPGSSNTIDNGDDAISGNVLQVGNFLYAVQSTASSGRTAVRWTIADATNFNIVQQGTISSGTLSYFFPSIAVNSVGDVVIGFSGSNSSTYVSTYAVVGTSAGGVPGGSLSFGSPPTPVQTKAGSDFYDGDRWGDYSATTPDPADPGIFWTNQEYAATRQFSGTNWNWATQASEIIPTKTGERRWSNAAGGSFTTAANYFTATAPVATDHVIFSRPGATYTVTFSGSNTSSRASVRQGNVNWNLGSGSYTLANASAGTPSLVVGEFQGTALLSLSGNALNTVNANIGGAAVGSGTVDVNSGTTWTNSAALSVGAAGTGTLTGQSLSSVYVGTNLSIGGFGTVNLNGGTIRFDGYSRAPGGTVNFTSGTVQVAGNRTIDTDAAIKDWFGNSPTIGVGKKLAVEGNANLSNSSPFTLAGGTLAASSLSLSSGSHLVATQSSHVLAPTSALSGSVIDATAGDLSIGDASSASGFYGNGTLSIGSHVVTLADSNGGVLDAAAAVTLGAAGNPGALAAATGLVLNAGGNIGGYGTINTPNNLATPLSNNGSLSGTSLAQPLTLPGYVKGIGTFDNVAFTGTFSPGASPAAVSLGSATYGGTLDIEIGGLTAGSQYDQLNHALASGVAQLGGTLNVSLISGFDPQEGDVFDILTAVGGVSGTFATTMLPALTGDLFWTIDYSSNLVELKVEAPPPVLQGDYNHDGSVDAADYVVWRTGFENNTFTLADYDVWRAHFGETNGGGSVAAKSAQIVVPEPASIILLVFDVLAANFCPRRRLDRVANRRRMIQ